MNKLEELKKEFIDTQCEPCEVMEEQCEVYENNGELVTDWWEERIKELLSSALTEMEGKRINTQSSVTTDEGYELRKINEPWDRGFNTAIDSCIQIIKNLTITTNE